MTNREFFAAVIEANLTEEITGHAQAALDRLDATNEKRREATIQKAAERETERAPMRDAIVAAMTTEPKTATTLIAEADLDIKPQAIPSLLRGLIEDGTVIKSDVKVTGKGKQVGYALAE